MKIKKPASKAGFSNLAPLTGIAFASNWLICKLNLNFRSVKTTRMTTIKRCTVDHVDVLLCEFTELN
ncbi:Uncharacterised protein [Klebsiella michiganensis]|nr:Uncharacterised protein [Klebsiella michiganensis]